MNTIIGGLVTTISIVFYVGSVLFTFIMFLGYGSRPSAPPSDTNFVMGLLMVVVISGVVFIYLGWRWHSYFLLSLPIWLIPLVIITSLNFLDKKIQNRYLAIIEPAYQEALATTKKDFICGVEDFLNSTEKHYANSPNTYQSVTRFYRREDGEPVIGEEVASIKNEKGVHGIVVRYGQKSASLIENCRDAEGKNVTDRHPGYKVMTEEEWFLALDALEPVTAEELEQGWYYGRSKRPGTPDTWQYKVEEDGYARGYTRWYDPAKSN